MARTILTLLTLLLVPPAVHAQSTWVKVCEKANAVTKDKLRSLTLATRCAIPRDVPQRWKPRLNSSLA